MARIVDKDTRLIDVDFGPVTVVLQRSVGSFVADTLATSGNGTEQILNTVPTGGPSTTGSFVQYSRVDLSQMTMNNEVMQPVEASIQRTSPVPLGFHINGNNLEQMEEYIYIFSRPLNNTDIAQQLVLNVEDFRSMGLDRSTDGITSGGVPNHGQTIYAEKRMYSYSNAISASITNGELSGGQNNVDYNTIYAMPVLDSVTTWGTLSTITGPNLHCYRVVIMRNQGFVPAQPALWANVDGLPNAVGQTTCDWPPVNITFLCKDPQFSEGEYLTRLANAMTSVAEGGPTA